MWKTPDHLEAELTVPQYNELIAFLSLSKWHLRSSWRDDAIGYGNFWASRAVHSKAAIDHFLIETEKEEPEAQSIEQQEILLRANLASFGKKKAKAI